MQGFANTQPSSVKKTKKSWNSINKFGWIYIWIYNFITGDEEPFDFFMCKDIWNKIRSSMSNIFRAIRIYSQGIQISGKVNYFINSAITGAFFFVDGRFCPLFKKLLCYSNLNILFSNSKAIKHSKSEFSMTILVP